MDLTRHYEGREQRQWPGPGHAWVLGCDCGAVGCWPLTTRVTVTGSDVTWSDFSQDRRPSWDYAGFGPFIFDREGYGSAVARVVASAG